MPDKAKRKYGGELMRFNKSLNRPLSKIKEVLPEEYSGEIVVNCFKQFYPLIWKQMKERYTLYSKKDDFLKKEMGKVRYKPLPPDQYLLNLPQVKLWLSKGTRASHKETFCLQNKLDKEKILLNKKENSTKKFKTKILDYTKDIQEVDVLYLDAFIIAYHQKGITIDGKIEVFNELKKYNNPKTLDFFYKLNDSERNNQIRKLAFEHIQSLGKYVKLRGNFNGKQKVYMVESSQFDMTPKDLLDKIERNEIQNKKTYNFFISHSSSDSDSVLKTIDCLNRLGFNAYCDWTSDNDFLKRTLVSDFTKEVLKKRLNQSEKLLLLKSKKAMSSEWVALELSHFEKLGKKIHYIELDETIDNRLKNFNRIDYDFERQYLNIPKK